ncbi:MAG: hypothetical protein ACR2JF_07000 [Iamia sp.]
MWADQVAGAVEDFFAAAARAVQALDAAPSPGQVPGARMGEWRTSAT